MPEYNSFRRDRPGTDEIADTKADKNTSFWSKLTKNEFLLLVLSLVIGVTVYYLADLLEGGRDIAPAFSLNKKLFAEALKDIALIVVSLGFFESLKDLLIKKEEEAERINAMEDVLKQARSGFIQELDDGKDILAFGIRRVYSSFGSEQLRSIIQTLEEGDSLYCHVGTISNFSDLKNIITEKAKEGIDFRWMALAPYCMNAIRRAGELDEDIESYSNECKAMSTTLASIIKSLAAFPIKDEPPKRIGTVQFKLYRSLASDPFYIIARKK